MPSSFQPNPNPQGKGLVPVLQDWASLHTGLVATKPAAEFLRDYCVSALILGAAFRFKPVVGIDYFLYERERNLALSLIAPQEWGHYQPGEFLARCELRADMTWQMDIADLDDDSTALATARDFIGTFVHSLAEQDSISDTLPYYVETLPYYQRMLATALASSLRQSMPDQADDMKKMLRDQPELIAPPGCRPLPA